MLDRAIEAYLCKGSQTLDAGAVRHLTVVANGGPVVSARVVPINRRAVARRLSLARSYAHQTLAKAAQLAGLKEELLLAYETGTASPELMDLIQLGKVYGASLDWMMGVTPEADEAHHPAGITDPRTIRDLQTIRAMSSGLIWCDAPTAADTKVTFSTS